MKYNPFPDLSHFINLFQVLRHLAAVAPIAKMWIQLLLTILHKSKVQIEYQVLPKTVENLLAVPSSMESTITIRDSFAKATCPTAPPKKIGQMMYYGISRAIEGISAGLEDKWRYFKDITLIDEIDPNFFTGPFKRIISGGNCGSASEKPLGSTETAEENEDPVRVLLHIFADGFSPYSNCTHNYWSVYGLVTGFFRHEKLFETKGVYNKRYWILSQNGKQFVFFSLSLSFDKTYHLV